MKKTFATALILLCSVAANALPLVWRADWPGSKPVETLVHRGTDIEFQPQWYINGELANSTNWTFQTFVQTNAQATGEWFGPLPGAAFSHTNDIGAAFYNVMVRAQMPGGGVNYTAFARLRMLDSPGFTPGELKLPVAVLDFAQVEVRNAEMIVPDISSNILIASALYTDRATNMLSASLSSQLSLSSQSATNYTDAATNATRKSAATYTDGATNALRQAVNDNLANNYYTAAETDDAIDALAAYYITANAQGAAFATYAALTNATVYYSGGVVRVPTRNDYAVVLADESHSGAEWRYIFAVANGATTGQWEAQYPIETNDYDALSNKPQINGHTLTKNQTGAALGLVDEAGNQLITGNKTFEGELNVDTASGGNFNIQNSIDGANANFSVVYVDSETGDVLQVTISDGLGHTHTLIFQNASGTLALLSDIAAASTAATNYVNAATNALPAWTKSATQPLPPDYANVSNKAYTALQTEVDPVWSSEKSNYATTAQLNAAVRYSFNNATVPSDTTPTVTGNIDRGINAATLGSTVTSATITLPAATTGKARDFFINLTIEASTAPTLTFVDPATSTTADVQFGSDSLAEITTGYNLILFTEIAANKFLVSVKHEDAQ